MDDFYIEHIRAYTDIKLQILEAEAARDPDRHHLDPNLDYQLYRDTFDGQIERHKRRKVPTADMTELEKARFRLTHYPESYDSLAKLALKYVNEFPSLAKEKFKVGTSSWDRLQYPLYFIVLATSESSTGHKVASCTLKDVVEVYNLHPEAIDDARLLEIACQQGAATGVIEFLLEKHQQIAPLSTGGCLIRGVFHRRRGRGCDPKLALDYQAETDIHNQEALLSAAEKIMDAFPGSVDIDLLEYALKHKNDYDMIKMLVTRLVHRWEATAQRDHTLDLTDVYSDTESSSVAIIVTALFPYINCLKFGLERHEFSSELVAGLEENQTITELSIEIKSYAETPGVNNPNNMNIVLACQSAEKLDRLLRKKKNLESLRLYTFGLVTGEAQIDRIWPCLRNNAKRLPPTLRSLTVHGINTASDVLSAFLHEGRLPPHVCLENMKITGNWSRAPRGNSFGTLEHLEIWKFHADADGIDEDDDTDTLDGLFRQVRTIKSIRRFDLGLKYWTVDATVAVANLLTRSHIQELRLDNFNVYWPLLTEALKTSTRLLNLRVYGGENPDPGPTDDELQSFLDMLENDNCSLEIVDLPCSLPEEMTEQVFRRNRLGRFGVQQISRPGVEAIEITNLLCNVAKTLKVEETEWSYFWEDEESEMETLRADTYFGLLRASDINGWCT